MTNKYSMSTLALILLAAVLFSSCAPAHPPLKTSAPVVAEAGLTLPAAQKLADTSTPVPPTLAPTATEIPPTSTQPAPTSTPTLKPGIITYANPQKYHIQYQVAVKNGGFTPRELRVYLPVPVEWDAQKDIKVNQVSPDPKSQAVEPNSGNAMVYWQVFGTPKLNTTETFLFDLDLTAYETITKIDPADILPYNKESQLYQRYIQSEKYIESSSPDIAALANKIAGLETNPYQIARKFYDYVIDNTSYILLGKGLNGASYVMKKRNGECGDFSALFVALSRAKGIPARPVVGYWAISGKDQTHVWAEFYLEGIGWVPADPTIGQQSASKRAYYFGNMDNNRVVLSKGYNLSLVPTGPDGYIASLMQVPLWWYWGSGDGNNMSMDWAWTAVKK